MLRPTFLAFETARRAITVSQLGLDTVGHNISNVSTPGYTRQRVDQVSMTASVYSEKFRIYGGAGQFAGQGVLLNGISQIRDPYLDTRYRNEASSYGSLATKINGLTDIENILDEIDNKGLSAQMEEFINELRKYGENPSSEELATTVRGMAKELALMMNTTANELVNALDQQKNDLNIAIATDINSALNEIAYLNQMIRQENILGNPANELMDQRNNLIDLVSEHVNIKVVNTPEKISDGRTISTLSIIMVDSSTAPASEFTLVDGADSNGFRMTENKDGTVSIDLVDSSGGLIRTDITDNITGGIVRGYLDVINGQGAYAGKGENAFRGIPYYMKALDTYAATFAETMNLINSITAAEAAGKPDIYEWLQKDLFTSVDGGPVTASNICITKSWEREVTYLTTTKEQPQAPEPVYDENGNPVLDENGDPVTKTQHNSDNITKFIEALEGTNNHFVIRNGDGQRITLYTGSFSGYINSLQVSDLGIDKKTLTTQFEASSNVISGYADLRDSVSAVSIDEEAINMMTYQNYYNAAVRYMTTLDEALNSIINGMGVVGR